MTRFPKSLPEILNIRAATQSDKIGYHFLADRDREFDPSAAETLTYGELYQSATAIAGYLQKQGYADERLLLMYAPGLEFIKAFFGCLLAGAIAVPTYLPRRRQKLSHIRHVAEDCGALGILTTESLRESLVNQWLEEGGDASVEFIATDATRGAVNTAFETQDVSPEDLAFLQYTSGSTGAPKGVMVSHGNLTANLETIYRKFGQSDQSVGVIWLPPHHDMGLIGGILQPFFGGYPVVLMSPMSFLQKPVRWLQAIAHYRATTSGGPNFAFERCCDRVTPEQIQDLDLSSWSLAFVGAEPVRSHTLIRFAETFAPCGFDPTALYPCYGLAEATLFVSGGDCSEAPVSDTAAEDVRVSSGTADKGQQIEVVDPETNTVCAAGELGEIWMAGPSVVQGYWQKPAETQDTFQAHLANGDGPFLRTGDLGFIKAGELFVTGRLKDLIIIRGQNYFPDDLEDTAESSHPEFGTAAAFAIERNGEEHLVIVQELTRAGVRALRQPTPLGPTSLHMVRAIRKAISESYGLQVDDIQLVKPGQVPVTSSGKIKHQACRELYLAGKFESLEVPSTPASIPTINPLERSAKITRDRIDWLRDYANSSINSQLMDERRCIPPPIVLDFGNQGLLGMQVPQKFDGLELGHFDTLKIVEQLGAIDPTLSLFVGLNNVLGIRPILRSASADLRAELLPKLATGRELAAFALTEPGAGSHPGAMTSTARKFEGDRYMLRGQKIWSGSAAWAGVINVFVQEQDEQGRLNGISGFVLRKNTTGLRQGPESLTMGMRGMVQNAIYLEDALVPADARLGNDGMAVAQDAMMYGRLAIAAASLGGMKRCAQLMFRYADKRTVSTGRLLNNPAILSKLGRINAQITGIESLVQTIATRLDANRRVPVELYAACKVLAPEFFWQAADDLIQCLGGRGYVETNVAPQFLRDSRILRIFEGPTETLSMYLGSRVCNHPEAIARFMSQDLNAAELATALTDGAATIQEQLGHLSQGPWSNPTTSRQQAFLAIGELASLAILGASLGTSTVPTPAQRQSLDWIRAQFDLKLESVLSPAVKATRSKAETIAQIEAYGADIGCLEQTLSGEDRAIDPLLKLSNSEPFEQPIRIPVTLPSSDATVKGLQGGIEQWLLSWMATNLKIEAAELSANQAFADYGLDSVTAVELVHDLEDQYHLEQPLDVTLAWNFPTVEALARYLARQLSAPEVSVETASTEEDPGVSDDALDEMSEAELAAILAQELAGIEGGANG
ncbi:MAG: AMP-binding protein [Cyanobacteria bacterium P01_F01_bin.42]